MASYLFRFLRANVRRGLNRPSRPFLVNYAVTFRCNLACKHCGAWRSPAEKNHEELREKDIRNMLEDNMLHNIDAVVITGGEPFLKEDLTEILLAFHSRIKPRIFHITTNGYATEDIVGKIMLLKKRGVSLDLKVSIDGMSTTHDALRGKEGSFSRAVDTLRRLRSRFSRKKLFLAVNQTVFPENVHEIPRVKKLADDLDVDYRGFVGLKEGGIERADYGLIEFSAPVRDYIRQNLTTDILSLGVKGSGSWRHILERIILAHYLKGQMNVLQTGRMPQHRCMNLFTHFRLHPNGDIITCSYDTEVLGNVKRESYSDILNKPIAKNKLRKVVHCGKCWLGCEVSPNWVSSLGGF